VKVNITIVAVRDEARRAQAEEKRCIQKETQYTAGQEVLQ